MAKYKTPPGIAMYLAMGRADTMCAVKEVARWQRGPVEAHMHAMKRLARYLAGAVDYTIVVMRPKGHGIFVTLGANWAGCRKTRRSSSCLVISVGGVVVSVASRTQTTLATSSGEAEFCAGVPGAVEGLRLRAALEFFGWQPKVTLAMDSSAARGAASRVGAGRLRTMELKTLWLQEPVEDGRVRL